MRNTHSIKRALLVAGMLTYSASPAFAGPKGGGKAACAQIAEARLFRKTETVEWKKDLRGTCPARSNGRMGICWLNSTLAYLEATLRMEGVLAPDQRLSAPYYAASLIRENAKRFFEDDSPFDLAQLTASFVGEAYYSILKQGIVLDGEFHLPVYMEKIMRRLKPTDVQFSRSLGAEFRDSLEDAVDESELKLVLSRYIGEPVKIDARPVSVELLQKYQPDIFVSEAAFIRDLELNRSNPVRVTVQDPKKIRAAIRGALDADLPVTIVVKNTELFANMRKLDGSPILSYSARKIEGGGHAVNIIGYGEDETGQAWFMLLNNSGEKWGSGGTVAVSAEFIDEHVQAVLTAPAKLRQ